MVEEQGDGVHAAVHLGVVVKAAFSLQLHCLTQQSLQPAGGQHHRGRQVGWTGEDQKERDRG